MVETAYGKLMLTIRPFRSATFFAVAFALMVEGAGAQVSLQMGVFASGAGQGFGDSATLRSLLAAGPVGTMLGDRYALHSGFWRVASAVTTVDPLPLAMPDAFGLEQNFPNPFNPATMIRYCLPLTCNVELGVHDMLGRQVAVLVNQKLDAGLHEVAFEASRLASGVYFYRLQAGDFVQTRRLILLR
jgi:hypothetical protein